jgi:hypothetical protein
MPVTRRIGSIARGITIHGRHNIIKQGSPQRHGCINRPARSGFGAQRRSVDRDCDDTWLKCASAHVGIHFAQVTLCVVFHGFKV